MTQFAKPEFPMVMVMFTDGVEGMPSHGSHVLWTVGRPHPFIPETSILRMFITDTGVEVYSWDSKAGARDLIPMNRIRLVREALSLEILMEELALAEAEKADDQDDEEDDDEEQNHPDAGNVSPPMNGQPVSSS